MGSRIKKLTYSQGTSLMRVAPVIKIPAAVGEKKFSSNVRATLNKKIRMLNKQLRKISPLVRSENTICFGPVSGWKRVERTPAECTALAKAAGIPRDQVEAVVYEVKEAEAFVEVRLSADARDGLYWILFMWSHPDSEQCQGAGTQDSLVWDVAEELRCTKALEKDTGISENETLEVKYDDEDEEEEDRPAGDSVEKVPDEAPKEQPAGV